MDKCKPGKYITMRMGVVYWQQRTPAPNPSIKFDKGHCFKPERHTTMKKYICYEYVCTKHHHACRKNKGNVKMVKQMAKC